MADVVDGRVRAAAAEHGAQVASFERAIADWIGASAGPIILALDAPLGWPAALGVDSKIGCFGGERMTL